MSDVSETRQSSQPNNVDLHDEEADREIPPSSKRAKTTSSKSYPERKPNEQKVASDEIRADAMERAEKLRSSLGCPSFTRSMGRSHVYTCFWLGIPREFCIEHLPRDDKKIILENENGEEHETNFLARRNGLSGGWRAFALKHQLDDGDAVVFELIKPARFKLYIVRAHHPKEENDAAVTQSVEEQKMEEPEPLLDLEAAPKPQPTKRNRRKTSRPMKSDDGVSKSQNISEEIVEEDTDEQILNGGVTTNNRVEVPLIAKKTKKQASPKKFRRSATQAKLFKKRRSWA